MNYSSYILLIPLLPLLAFVVLGLFGKKYFNTSAGVIATALLLISTGLSIYTAWQYFLVDARLNDVVGQGKVNEVYPSIKAVQYTWLTFNENLQIDIGVLLDPISVMMLVVISFVSLMVHMFSLWYMKGEERFATYYAFLGLFTFSMLGLVISTNIFQMYMFWELVGVSSFLLIGYYFQKPSAVAASKKAFIVTRFADLFFLIGILIVGVQSNSFDFGTIIQTLTNTQSPEFLAATSTSFIGASLLTWALALIFIGGAGKSAMFPLHIWLPDAMEGPTPVSALIHAATMVVAGVYLVARMFPVFAVNEASLQLVTWVGLTSALFAAIIACTQTDIKRVLAYSTMSQIGYMMFALGVSGYGGEAGLGFTGSLFHLFTHAFFKSLLFLAAGAVIHFVHSNEMTDIVFFVACLAIAGVPPLSGFFSKEEILLASFNADKIVYSIALLTSGLTAFYMFRLYFSIFWNKQTELHGEHHSEGTMTMKFPLVLLAVLTVVAGFVPFGEYVSSDSKPLETHLHILFSIAPVAMGLAGIGLAAYLYKNESERPTAIAHALGSIYKTAYKKFYIDELYLFITKKIIFNFIARPAAWIDKHIVDGTMNGLASVTGSFSALIKGWQSGKVQHYVLYFFGGVVVLGLIFIYLWK
jgi:NADH-quinone oxidoreductase subunit L